VISNSGYIEEEKLAIARKFLIPGNWPKMSRQARMEAWILRKGLAGHDRDYTFEAGVRNLEREMPHCRKVAPACGREQSAPRHVAVHSLDKYLGPPLPAG